MTPWIARQPRYRPAAVTSSQKCQGTFGCFEPEESLTPESHVGHVPSTSTEYSATSRLHVSHQVMAEVDHRWP